MPRNAPRPPSTHTEIPAAEASQAYGVAGEQQAALKAVPMPTANNGLATGVLSSPAGPAGAASPPPGAVPVDPTQAADQAHGLVPGATAGALATQMPTSLLSAPTARPGEPLTAGLSSGPGPGPEVLSLTNPATRPTPVGDVLAKLAAAAGNNPTLAQMAQEAKTRGV